MVDPATGRTLPRGEPGELCTRGYSVMLGYWEEPEKTAEAIDAARWMHTGDLAVMDSDGYLNITGRIKDLVVRGGENISPREVEEFLYTHPDVRDVQVVGVPDVRYGEELCAWVILRDGAAPLTRRGRAGVRGRPARVVQDPALRRGGRRVPDDGDRQGAQGRDAGAVGGAARPGGGGRGPHGVRSPWDRSGTEASSAPSVAHGAPDLPLFGTAADGGGAVGRRLPHRLDRGEVQRAVRPRLT